MPKASDMFLGGISDANISAMCHVQIDDSLDKWPLSRFVTAACPLLNIEWYRDTLWQKKMHKPWDWLKQSGQLSRPELGSDLSMPVIKNDPFHMKFRFASKPHYPMTRLGGAETSQARLRNYLVACGNSLKPMFCSTLRSQLSHPKSSMARFQAATRAGHAQVQVFNGSGTTSTRHQLPSSQRAQGSAPEVTRQRHFCSLSRPGAEGKRGPIDMKLVDFKADYANFKVENCRLSSSTAIC